MTVTQKRRVLSLDPGTVNCGAAIVEQTLSYKYSEKQKRYLYKGHKWKILHSVMLSSPISDMKALNEQAIAFREEITELAHNYKIHAIVAERFQSRGPRTGTTGECVSAMLGILTMIPAPSAQFYPCRVITASQWKNQFNKQDKKALTALYKEAKTLGFSPHRTDAALIGVYTIRQTMLERFKFKTALSFNPKRALSTYLERTQ